MTPALLPASTPPGWRAHLLRTLPCSRAYPPWVRLALLGDWNGDGVQDLVFQGDGQEEPLRVLSLDDGRCLAEFGGAPPRTVNGFWAPAFASPGDLDGDRRPEVVYLLEEVTAERGRVWTLCASGSRSSSPLWSHPLDVPTGTRPVCVSVLGDVDADGLADLVVGMPPGPLWPETAPRADRGFAAAFSSRDGRELWRVEGGEGLKLGWEIARCADMDGDRIADVAVLEVFRDDSAREHSSEDPKPRLDLRSGRTGQHIEFVVWERETLDSASPGAWRLTGGKDIDGDGLMDLVVRSLKGPRDSAHVLSGKASTRIATVHPYPDPAGREESWFPSAIEVASDLDGDGWFDLLLGHDEVGTENGLDYGAIYVHSTRTNAQLAAVWGTPDDRKLGGALAWLGDTDRDGAPEFAAVTPNGIRIYALVRP